MALGTLKIKGVGFGAAMVLFTAIFVSALGESAGYDFVPAKLGTFGLVLFAFSIGNDGVPTSSPDSSGEPAPS